MTTETTFRLAFLVLLLALLAMRVFFMLRVRLAGERLLPDQKAIAREGGRVVLMVRVAGFFLLMAFLVMYFTRSAWIDVFLFSLPAWLRWAGFVMGLVSVLFWTWTQVSLDTQWSAQLQLTKEHHLVTSGPYARMRHPLYTAMIGWSCSLAVLTANWIFVFIAALTLAAVVWRVPKEEKMMLEAFGEDYKAFTLRTGRYLPRL